MVILESNTTVGTNGPAVPAVPATETETTSNTEGNQETTATQESGSGNNNIKKIQLWMPTGKNITLRRH